LYRGFKKWAEELSLQQRRNIGLFSYDPLPAAQLAGNLGIRILTIQDLPYVPNDIVYQLTEVDPDSWSAFTIPVDGGHVILHNSAHSSRRQESNLMHEIAHVLCKHQALNSLQPFGFPFPLRTYNREQENEASWLGGCLQLPRDGLLWAIQLGMSNLKIASHFGASEYLVKYRRNVTGVDVQFSRRRSLH
jgi:hypothetical protein